MRQVRRRQSVFSFLLEDVVAHEGEGDTAKVGTSSEAGDDGVGIFTRHFHLLFGFQSDDGLVQSTWLNTEPRVYLQLGVVCASSMASEMAVPSEP